MHSSEMMSKLALKNVGTNGAKKSRINNSPGPVDYMLSYSAVASLPVLSWPDLQALAGDIVLFSWAGDFSLTVPLSTQVYKWAPAK